MIYGKKSKQANRSYSISLLVLIRESGIKKELDVPMFACRHLVCLVFLSWSATSLRIRQAIGSTTKQKSVQTLATDWG